MPSEICSNSKFNGRARWKVENENNNVLKNRGYHLGHNFGHGNKHLSSFPVTFNLLSFLFHTLLEQVDKKYKLVRDNLPARQTFGLDHLFGHVLGRGGFHICTVRGRIWNPPLQFGPNNDQGQTFFDDIRALTRYLYFDN